MHEPRRAPRSSTTPMVSGVAPSHDTYVVYDGQCAFCRRWVERLHRWDRKKKLYFISLHDPEVERSFLRLSRDDLMRELHVVDRRGRLHRGARAIRYLSRRLRSLWWLAPILHLPFSLVLWDLLYRKTSEGRYGLSSVGSCMNSSGNCRIGARRVEQVEMTIRDPP